MRKLLIFILIMVAKSTAANDFNRFISRFQPATSFRIKNDTLLYTYNKKPHELTFAKKTRCCARK